MSHNVQTNLKFILHWTQKLKPNDPQVYFKTNAIIVNLKVQLRLKVWSCRAEPDKMSLRYPTMATVHSSAFPLMPLSGQISPL